MNYSLRFKGKPEARGVNWPCCARTIPPALLILLIGIALPTFSIGNFLDAQQINSIIESKDLPISVSAKEATRWQQGSYHVWHLKDQVVISQGNTTLRAPQAIAWHEKADPQKEIPSKLIVYAEGHDSTHTGNFGSERLNNDKVIVETLRAGDPHRVTGQVSDQQKSKSWLGRFYSNFGVQFNTPILIPPPDQIPPIFERGIKQRQKESQQAEIILAQFQQPLQEPVAPPQDQFQRAPRSGTTPTKIDFKPRSKNPLNVRAFPSPDRSENIVLYTGGVRVTVEGQSLQPLQSQKTGGVGSPERVTIEADTVVAWTNPIRQLVENKTDNSAKRWEIYLEGNIVFSTNDRVIYANRMYYDVQLKRGTILKAEMYSKIPGYEGMLRLKANVLEQIDENNARAYGSAITSSRIGVPRYWLQSEVLDLNRRPRLDFNELGQIEYDSQTGQPKTAWTYDGTSRNNFLYVLGAPVLFWPALNGNSDQSSYYISGLTIKNDNVFGMQTYSKWNAYQLFGVRRPPDNTNWNLNLDYLSDRGLGLGTEGDYDLKDPYGFKNLNKGLFEAWGIFDEGVDNVGRGRRTLVPEENFRGRVFWQHRTRFANGLEWIGETGIVSDRNFLEQYREREWDQRKDHVNRLQIKKLLGDQSLNLSASYRTSDFFTQTSQLPSFNYFLLGRSLLNNRLTWSMHTHVGYHDLDVADAPIDPSDAARFDPLAWEVPRDGVIAGIRNEVSLPVQTGIVRTTPYFISESTFYGEDALGNR
ncbi:MAG: hypothetical protein VX438_12910, partial [Planctomycetota bacterium]|nr:hypothetical protein [Planctomycetota bacterium]